MTVENPALSKFVKRSENCVREAILERTTSGVVDLESLMNRVVDITERIQLLADRGDGFEDQRTEALEIVFNNLARLQAFDDGSIKTCGIPLDSNVSEEEVLSYRRSPRSLWDIERKIYGGGAA